MSAAALPENGTNITAYINILHVLSSIYIRKLYIYANDFYVLTTVILKYTNM